MGKGQIKLNSILHYFEKAKLHWTWAQPCWEYGWGHFLFWQRFDIFPSEPLWESLHGAIFNVFTFNYSVLISKYKLIYESRVYELLTTFLAKHFLSVYGYFNNGEESKNSKFEFLGQFFIDIIVLLNLDNTRLLF